MMVVPLGGRGSCRAVVLVFFTTECHGSTRKNGTVVGVASRVETHDGALEIEWCGAPVVFVLEKIARVASGSGVLRSGSRMENRCCSRCIATRIWDGGPNPHRLEIAIQIVYHSTVRISPELPRDEEDMVTSIELSEQELAELRELTEQSDSTEAIRVAMRDYIRYARRIRLKQLSGQVEMMDNWRQLEQSEIGDHNGDVSK